MPLVHLVEGPVGAGKSTLSAKLAARFLGVHIALDHWFAALYSPDRPPGDFVRWYAERKERLIDALWNHSRKILASERDVVLELGLIQRDQRLAFCRRVRDEGHPLLIYVVDAPVELRRERVRMRNVEKGATFAMLVPDHLFETASQLWEPPDEAECEEFDVEFVGLRDRS